MAAAEEAALRASARKWLLAPPLVAAASEGDVGQAWRVLQLAEERKGAVPSSCLAAASKRAGAEEEEKKESLLHLLADGGIWRQSRPESASSSSRKRAASYGSTSTSSSSPHEEETETEDDEYDDPRTAALTALLPTLVAAAPALLHTRDKDGHLPICRAAATGHPLALRLLLQAHRVRAYFVLCVLFKGLG